MGDSTTNVAHTEPAPNQATPAAPTAEPKEQTTSKEILRESKPSPNISIKAPSTTGQLDVPSDATQPKEGTIQGSIPSVGGGPPAKIETVFEKLDIGSDKSDSTTDSVDSAKNKAAAPPDPPPEIIDKKGSANQKNRSSIFSTDHDKKGSTIFSIKGTPSGRLNRRRDLSSTVFPVGCMGCKENSPEQVDLFSGATARNVPEDSPRNQRPSSGLSEQVRNPLTGVGVGYTEEVRKNPSARRRDGNPVLGLGYETDVASTPSSNRIPPGGFSKGLW